MEEKRKCFNCMADMRAGESVCGKCGFDNRTASQPIYALPSHYLLHGRYIIGKILGQGGFGITYLAWDRLLDMKVAVKEYFPMGMVTRDAGASTELLWSAAQSDHALRQKGYDSFLKEARKMAKIDEIPSIVRVRDVFLENETAYIAMDFVEGITLKEFLLKNGALPFGECVRLLRPIMEGLGTVHAQKIIHRDISPDNIMIRKDGRVMLLDLGAAKDMTDVKGQKSQLVAKNGFSPMEQYVQNKAIGAWTDVYALCATIYYCVTGKVAPAALERLEDEELEYPQGADERISESEKAVLRDGMKVKPEERIFNVEELLRRLDEAEAIPEERVQSVDEWTQGFDGADRNFKEEKDKEANKGQMKRLAWAGILLAAAICVLAVYVGDKEKLRVQENPPVTQKGHEDDSSVIQESYEGDFDYTEYKDHITVSRYKGQNNDVVIPSTINGKAVTEIEDSAFRNCKELTTVTIPDGVTKIGDSAFRSCRKLITVTIPDSLTEIGEYAFQFCERLSEVRIPDGVTEIRNRSFSGCTNLKAVTIPDSVTKIGEYAFQYCRQLSVTIPDSVTEIGDGAFYYCIFVTIPDSVTKLGKDVFI